VDGGEWNAEQRSHAQSCNACAALLSDLRAIAQEAKQLAASEEPSPRVWQELRKSLEAERLIRRQPSGFFAGLFPRWRPALVPLAATAVLVLAVVMYRSGNGPTDVSRNTPPPPPQLADVLDQDDLQLLASISDKAPAMRAEYEKNLKHVNAYIRDAKKTAEQNPTDGEARDQLVTAYEQKAMVYDMAMDRGVR
jgi:hypothetical protein